MLDGHSPWTLIDLLRYVSIVYALAALEGLVAVHDLTVGDGFITSNQLSLSHVAFFSAGFKLSAQLGQWTQVISQQQPADHGCLQCA